MVHLMSSFRLVVPLDVGGCSEQWVRSGGQGTFPRLWPLVALAFQAPAGLALRTSRPTTGVFYRFDERLVKSKLSSWAACYMG